MRVAFDTYKKKKLVSLELAVKHEECLKHIFTFLVFLTDLLKVGCMQRKEYLFVLFLECQKHFAILP